MNDTRREQKLDPKLRLARLPLPKLWWAWLLGLAAATYLLGTVAKAMSNDSPGEFSIDQAFSSAHSPLLTALSESIAWLLSPFPAVIWIALCCLVLLIFRSSPVNALAFGWVVAISWLSCEVFKHLINRPRPDFHLLADPLLPESGTDSFPSGHTAIAFSLAFGFWLLARGSKWAKPVAILGVVFSLLVGLSRVYLGVHYPSDVFGSLLASSAGAIVAMALWNLLLSRWVARMAWLRRFGPLPELPVAA
ncbi:undecaprenyl-diphosphatase [Psychromicrobium silvestre]|uniref:Undecaprenyl-diphosphatase n=1 Tax=Psychromicrobium silvestre TaxID=1645614 RepID=A0A7Y9LUM8_9MICC|nr:phosphatase PAP2 family protein [Psychromicrobium silvestre]NYE95919.1 undecaprenyl-diphosphatase [Psychromicrobium silvestre]